MKRMSVMLLLFVLVVPLSCSQCKKKGKTANLTGLVPADVAAVVVLPDLRQTIGDFDAWMKKFSVGPAATFLTQGKLEIVRRLGFDPFVAQDWRKIGVDPERGLAIVLDPARTLVVVGVSDAEVFASEVHKRIKEMTGADRVVTSKENGITVTSIGAQVAEHTYAHLHYTLTGGYALITGMAGDAKLLATCAGLKPDQSLSGAKWYSGLTGKIPGDSDLQIFVQGSRASELLTRSDPQLARALKEGGALALSISSGGLSLTAFVGMDPELSRKAKELASPAPDGHLERYLPADTFAALKLRIHPEKILQLALQSEPQAREEYQKVFSAAREALGMDVEAATIRNLSGNGVIGISLGKPDQINRVIASQDPSEVGGAFGILGWVQLKKGAEFTRAFDLAAGDKLPGEKSVVGPLGVLTFPVRPGMQVQLLHHQNLAGLCLGEGCTGRAAALVSGKEKALPTAYSAEAKKLFNEPSLVAGYLNFKQVLDTLSGLDPSAFGQGGMMVKMVLDMAIGAIKNLKEITGMIRIEPGGLVIQGHLRIQ